MNLKKKCPSCGFVNPEAEFFCSSCGTDLSGVKAGLLTEGGPAVGRPEARQAKRCPQCGDENESYAMLCSRPGCGALLGDKPPTKEGFRKPLDSQESRELDRTRREPNAKRLLLAVGAASFECKSGDVLGREGTLAVDVFIGIATVSARHVALECCRGEWRVTNLALQTGKTAKNITALDGRELAIGASAVLSGEHTLKLSTRCEVKLRVV